jgi:hypothetical protein
VPDAGADRERGEAELVDRYDLIGTRVDGWRRNRRQRDVGNRRIVIRQPLHAIRIVAQHLGKVGVHPHMRDVGDIAGKVGRGQDVIDGLRVAVEHVRVTLIERPRVGHQHEIGIDEIRTRERHQARSCRRALDRRDPVDVGVVDVEGVEIADDKNLLAGIGKLARLHQVRQELRLRAPLGAHALTVGVVRLHAIQRSQMVVDLLLWAQTDGAASGP